MIVLLHSIIVKQDSLSSIVLVAFHIVGRIVKQDSPSLIVWLHSILLGELRSKIHHLWKIIAATMTLWFLMILVECLCYSWFWFLKYGAERTFPQPSPILILDYSSFHVRLLCGWLLWGCKLFAWVHSCVTNGLHVCYHFVFVCTSQNHCQPTMGKFSFL